MIKNINNTNYHVDQVLLVYVVVHVVLRHGQKQLPMLPMPVHTVMNIGPDAGPYLEGFCGRLSALVE